MFANSLVELLQSDTDGKFAFTLGALFGGGLNTYKPPEEKPAKERPKKPIRQY